MADKHVKGGENTSKKLIKLQKSSLQTINSGIKQQQIDWKWHIPANPSFPSQPPPSIHTSKCMIIPKTPSITSKTMHNCLPSSELLRKNNNFIFNNNYQIASCFEGALQKAFSNQHIKKSIPRSMQNTNEAQQGWEAGPLPQALQELWISWIMLLWAEKGPL